MKDTLTEVRKNIDLPENVVRKLEKLATKQRTKVKPYMEKVLIDHSKLTANG